MLFYDFFATSRFYSAQHRQTDWYSTPAGIIFEGTKQRCSVAMLVLSNSGAIEIPQLIKNCIATMYNVHCDWGIILEGTKQRCSVAMLFLSNSSEIEILLLIKNVIPTMYNVHVSMIFNVTGVSFNLIVFG